MKREATVSARVPRDLYDDLTVIANGTGSDLSHVIRAILRQGADTMLAQAAGGLFATAPTDLLPLPGEGAHRHDDPTTSRKAARDVAPRLGNLYGKIIAAIHAHGPMTHGELVDRGVIRQSTVGPRLTELTRSRYLMDLGERPGPGTGSMQTVHALTPAAVAWLEAQG